MVSFGCFGQQESTFVDTLYSLDPKVNDSFYRAKVGSILWYDTLVPVLDTVPVIMLCIDTSAHQSSFAEFRNGDLAIKPSGTSAGITFPTASHPDLEETFYDYSVFWVKGYQVGSVYSVSGYGSKRFIGEQPFYLNERKKKLNPCYIVWQSIEIK